MGVYFTKIEKSSGVIPQEQHGGRSGDASIKVAVLRRLLFDYVRQTRINSALEFYDAENCYACVAQKLDSLSDQALDMPLSEISCCLKEIQEMKFYPRAVFGKSKGPYSKIMIQTFQRIYKVMD